MVRIARLTIVLFVCAAALGSLAPAASGRDDPRARWRETQARLAHAQAMLDAAKARESQLAGQVATFDQQLGSIGSRLSDIQGKTKAVQADLVETRAKLLDLRAELARKRKELRIAQAELRSQQVVFEARVVATYKQGDVDYLGVLLGATGYEDLVTRLSLVRELVNADNTLVGRLDQTRQTVALEKQALATSTAAAAEAEKALERQSVRLGELKTAAEQQMTQLAAARAAKAGVLQQATVDRQAWAQQQQELMAESQRLADLIRAGSSHTGAHGTGAFVWPVVGPITSPYGSRTNPISGAYEFHPGIDIGVAYGTPIHAADSGTVIYAGSAMTGYGNVIVIDHGNGLSTLYAHQSAFAVTGGAVTRGQVIGYVGTTGFSTGPHLHFEVRVGGNTVDPMGYLP